MRNLVKRKRRKYRSLEEDTTGSHERLPRTPSGGTHVTIAQLRDSFTELSLSPQDSDTPCVHSSQEDIQMSPLVGVADTCGLLPGAAPRRPPIWKLHKGKMSSHKNKKKDEELVITVEAEQTTGKAVKSKKKKKSKKRIVRKGLWKACRKSWKYFRAGLSLYTAMSPNVTGNLSDLATAAARTRRK